MVARLAVLLSALILASVAPGAQDVPASRRATRAEREAAARLAPRLRAQHVSLGAPVCLRIFK